MYIAHNDHFMWKQNPEVVHNITYSLTHTTPDSYDGISMKLIIMSGQEKTPYLFIYTYMYRYLCEYSNKINFTDLFKNIL